jgi:hypothetical protein
MPNASVTQLDLFAQRIVLAPCARQNRAAVTESKSRLGMGLMDPFQSAGQLIAPAGQLVRLATFCSNATFETCEASSSPWSEDMSIESSRGLLHPSGREICKLALADTFESGHNLLRSGPNVLDQYVVVNLLLGRWVDERVHGLICQFIGPRVAHDPCLFETCRNSLLGCQMAFDPSHFFDAVMEFPESCMLPFSITKFLSHEQLGSSSGCTVGDHTDGTSLGSHACHVHAHVFCSP